jgi:hypothetical protein
VGDDMTAAVVALAAIAALLAVAVVGLVLDHQAERRAWSVERKALLDRVIARHTGEVLAMEQATHPRPLRAEPRPIAEGL